MDFASFPTLLLVVQNTLYQSIFYDCLYHSYSCFYRIYIHINILSFLDVTSPLTVGTKITHAVPRVSCGGELYVFIQRLVSQRFSMCWYQLFVYDDELLLRFIPLYSIGMNV